MKKILAVSSIVIAILLVLISFNSAAYVQATRTTLLSKPGGFFKGNDIIDLFQKFKKISVKNPYPYGVLIAFIIFILSYIMYFIESLPMAIGNIINSMLKPTSLFFLILSFIGFIFLVIFVLSYFSAYAGLYLLFVFTFFLASLMGYQIYFPSPGPL